MTEVDLLYNKYCKDETKYCSVKKNTNQVEITKLCTENYELMTSRTLLLSYLYESELGKIKDINLFIVPEILRKFNINELKYKINIEPIEEKFTDNINFFYYYTFYSDSQKIQEDTWKKRLGQINKDELNTFITNMKENQDYIDTVVFDVNEKIQKFLQEYIEKYLTCILEYNQKCNQIKDNFNYLEIQQPFGITLTNKNRLLKFQKKMEQTATTTNLIKITINKTIILLNECLEYNFTKLITEDFSKKSVLMSSCIIDKILEPLTGKSDFIFNICSGARIDMMIPVFALHKITQNLDDASINKFSIISFCDEDYNTHKSTKDSGQGNISFNSILFEYLNDDENILSIIKTYNSDHIITEESKAQLISIVRSRLNIYYISSGKYITGVYNYFFPLLYNKLIMKDLILQKQPIFIHTGFAAKGNYIDTEVSKILYYVEQNTSLVFYGTDFLVYPKKGYYKRFFQKNKSMENCKIDGKSCYPNLKIEGVDYNQNIYTVFTKDAVAEFY